MEKKELIIAPFKTVDIKSAKAFRLQTTIGMGSAGFTNQISLYYKGWEVPVGTVVNIKSGFVEVGGTIDSSSISWSKEGMIYSFSLSKGFNLLIKDKHVKWRFYPIELVRGLKTSPGEVVFWTFINGVMTAIQTKDTSYLNPIKMMYTTISEIPSSFIDFIVSDVLFLKTTWIQKLTGGEKANIEKIMKTGRLPTTRYAIKRLLAREKDLPAFLKSTLWHLQDEAQRQGTAYVQIAKAFGLVKTSKKMAEERINEKINEMQELLKKNNLNYGDKEKLMSNFMYLLYKLQPGVTNVSSKTKETIAEFLSTNGNKILDIYYSQKIDEMLKHKPTDVSNEAFLSAQMMQIQQLIQLVRNSGINTLQYFQFNNKLEEFYKDLKIRKSLEKFIVIENKEVENKKVNEEETEKKIKEYLDEKKGKNIYLKFLKGLSKITSGVVKDPGIGEEYYLNAIRELIEIVKNCDENKIDLNNTEKQKIKNIIFNVINGEIEKIEKIYNETIKELENEINEGRPDKSDLIKILNKLYAIYGIIKEKKLRDLDISLYQNNILNIDERRMLFGQMYKNKMLIEYANYIINLQTTMSEIEEEMNKSEVDYVKVWWKLKEAEEIQNKISSINKKYESKIKKEIENIKNKIQKTFKEHIIVIDGKYLEKYEGMEIDGPDGKINIYEKNMTKLVKFILNQIANGTKFEIRDEKLQAELKKRISSKHIEEENGKMFIVLEKAMKSNELKTKYLSR